MPTPWAGPDDSDPGRARGLLGRRRPRALAAHRARARARRWSPTRRPPARIGATEHVHVAVGSLAGRRRARRTRSPPIRHAATALGWGGRMLVEQQHDLDDLARRLVVDARHRPVGLPLGRAGRTRRRARRARHARRVAGRDPRPAPVRRRRRRGRLVRAHRATAMSTPSTRTIDEPSRSGRGGAGPPGRPSPSPRARTAGGPAPVEAAAPAPAARAGSASSRDAARPVADPALDRLAALVAARIRHTMRSEYDELVANVELMRAEHAAHAATPSTASNAFGAGGAATRLDALETNGELMKAELAAFRSQPRRARPGHRARRRARRRARPLRRAPRAAQRPRPARARSAYPSPTPRHRRADAAPGRGAGAGDRPPTRPAASTTSGSSGGSAATPPPCSPTLADRYATLLADHQPVLDFGCGRGELVDGARARVASTASGVDPDPGMVAEAQGHGRAVVLGDGLEYLRAVPANELGAVISVHVVEHLAAPGARRAARARRGPPATRRGLHRRDAEPDVAHRARQLLHPRPDPRVAVAPVAA